jgi:hypothetical protein
LEGELKVEALAGQLSRVCALSDKTSAVVLCSHEYASKRDEIQLMPKLSLATRLPAWTRPASFVITDWARLEFAEESGIHNLAELSTFGVAGEFTITLGDSPDEQAVMVSSANKSLGLGVDWDGVLVYGSKKRDDGEGKSEESTPPAAPTEELSEPITA